MKREVRFVNEIPGKLLREGVFDGQLWVGTTSQADAGGWLGTVLHLPLGEAMSQFVEFSSGVFDKP